MQIPVSSQAEYDKAIKNKLHTGNEIVIQNSTDFINVRTDVTVGKNGRCKTDDKSTVTINVKENGMATVNGKTTVIGHDKANIIAKGNCKITLHDSSFGNCSEHCNITLKGASKISAVDNCSVYAYDESTVLATGNSKIYSYQNATAKGSGLSSITAKDNCIVYANENCSVKARDNCLVVANKYAKIDARDNCLIMSIENPKENINISDKCVHLKLEEVNDKNIMSSLKQMAQSKAVIERPLAAIQTLKENILPARKESVNRMLNTMGLKDEISIKNHLFKLIEPEPAIKNQASKQNIEKQLETAHKAGFVQGVCECVAVVGNEQNMGKKLLSEMNVTKDMAKKYANAETYKTLEKGIFAQKPEQKLEQTQGVKR